MLVKKDVYTKSIVLCALLFFVVLCSMDKPEINLFLTKDIIDNQIKLQLSLQEMSRFSRTCKVHKQIIDLENICSSPGIPCSIYACACLQQCHYDIRTKVLAHYAKTENEAIFHHLWMQEQKLRDADLKAFMRDSWSTQEVGLMWVKNKMDKYYKHYSNSKKIEKVRCKQLVNGLFHINSRIGFLKKILPGSYFNIFDNAYRKKRATGITANFNYDLGIILRSVCEFEDADLLLAILGGFIEPRAFKYIFRYAEPNLLSELISRDVFPKGVPDKRGKDFDYYMNYYISPLERRINVYHGPLLH